MNLTEGYLGRAPPDIVRSVMPNSFSNRDFYPGKDVTQVMGPYENNMTQHEKHGNVTGGTWPRLVQGPSHAKYPPEKPLDNSAIFSPSTVLPSPRSLSSRFLSQSVESPLWSDGRPDSARVPFSSPSIPSTVTIHDFYAETLPGHSHNTHRYSSMDRQPGSIVTSFGARPQNNKDPARSPPMRHGASFQGPFYAAGYDHPHQSWNNAGGTHGSRRETVLHVSKSPGSAAETGTGDCYTRVTQQLMRDSVDFAVDSLHAAMSQTRYNSQQRAGNESNSAGKALLAFPVHGLSPSSPEENSRNPDNFGYASVNKMQHLWRDYSHPVGRVDLSGSGDSRGFPRKPIVGHSPRSPLTERLADNITRERPTLLDTTVGGRNDLPRSYHSHNRNFSDDRSVSQDDILSHNRSFTQDRSFSHDDTFSRSRNLAHDHSFTYDGDSKGMDSGKRTHLNGVGARLEGYLHQRMTPSDHTKTTEPVKGHGSRFVKEMFSIKYDNRRGGNNTQEEDLVSSAGVTEVAEEGTKTAVECSKALMGQHRKWIEMEERLLSRIYELQKERSHLTAKVEELTAQNLDLSKKFKAAAEQLEARELEMENVRSQLREKIIDMTSAIYTSHATNSTPPSSHRDALSSKIRSNQQRCHDDDVDARRGRQMAQEELAACQIRFARERERWIGEKVKVLRYQQLLQAKYEQVVAENQLLKEQVGKEFCQNPTPVRSILAQENLTLLKDVPSGRSLDSIC